MPTSSDGVFHTFEVGPRLDVTNEMYSEYQDAFVDTTFLGPATRLVSEIGRASCRERV